MSSDQTPAGEPARRNGVRMPNESEEYRRARDALLAEAIELRRHIERMARQRREWPPDRPRPRISGEMGFATAGLGQDPRGGPDLMPLRTILDSTAEGRRADWYPKLEYK